MQQLVLYLSHPAVQVLAVAVLVILAFFATLLLAVAIMMPFSRDSNFMIKNRRQPAYRPQTHVWQQPSQLRCVRPAVIQSQPPSSQTLTPQLTSGDLDNTLIKYIFDE